MSTNTHNEKWREAIDDRQEKQKEEFLKSLGENPVIQRACKKVDISRSTLYRWMEDADFKAKVEITKDQGRATMNDLVESALLNRIQEGNVKATTFYLDHVHPDYQQKSIFDRDRARQEDEAKLRKNTLDFTIALCQQLGLKINKSKEFTIEVIANILGLDLASMRHEIIKFIEEQEERLEEDSGDLQA